MNPVFVISTGRTGTTFLAETLNLLGARSAHEPGPAWLRLLSNAYAANAVSHNTAVSLFRYARSPKSLWDIEASCLIYGLTRPILETVPNGQVVHLVRDPRTYVRSAMNWGVHRPGGRPLNVIPYRRLTPPQISGRSPEALLDWARRSQFSRVCWTWRTQNEVMRSHGDGEDRFVTIRMEDLFDQTTGYAGFRTILDLAGLPAPSTEELDSLLSRKINKAPRQSFPHWRDWTTTQLEELLRECGELADVFGYPVTEEVETVIRESSGG